MLRRSGSSTTRRPWQNENCSKGGKCAANDKAEHAPVTWAQVSRILHQAVESTSTLRCQSSIDTVLEMLPDASSTLDSKAQPYAFAALKRALELVDPSKSCLKVNNLRKRAYSLSVLIADALASSSKNNLSTKVISVAMRAYLSLANFAIDDGEFQLCLTLLGSFHKIFSVEDQVQNFFIVPVIYPNLQTHYNDLFYYFIILFKLLVSSGSKFDVLESGLMASLSDSNGCFVWIINIIEGAKIPSENIAVLNTILTKLEADNKLPLGFYHACYYVLSLSTKRDDSNKKLKLFLKKCLASSTSHMDQFLFLANTLERSVNPSQLDEFNLVKVWLMLKLKTPNLSEVINVMQPKTTHETAKWILEALDRFVRRELLHQEIEDFTEVRDEIQDDSSDIITECSALVILEMMKSLNDANNSRATLQAMHTFHTALQKVSSSSKKAKYWLRLALNFELSALQTNKIETSSSENMIHSWFKLTEVCAQLLDFVGEKKKFVAISDHMFSKAISFVKESKSSASHWLRLSLLLSTRDTWERTCSKYFTAIHNLNKKGQCNEDVFVFKDLISLYQNEKATSTSFDRSGKEIEKLAMFMLQILDNSFNLAHLSMLLMHETPLQETYLSIMERILLYLIQQKIQLSSKLALTISLSLQSVLQSATEANSRLTFLSLSFVCLLFDLEVNSIQSRSSDILELLSNKTPDTAKFANLCLDTVKFSVLLASGQNRNSPRIKEICKSWSRIDIAPIKKMNETSTFFMCTLLKQFATVLCYENLDRYVPVIIVPLSEFSKLCTLFTLPKSLTYNLCFEILAIQMNCGLMCNLTESMVSHCFHQKEKDQCSELDLYSTLMEKVAKSFSAYLSGNISVFCQNIEYFFQLEEKCDDLRKFREVIGMTVSEFVLIYSLVHVYNAAICFRTGNLIDALVTIEKAETLLNQYLIRPMTSSPKDVTLGFKLRGAPIWFRLIEFKGLIAEHQGAMQEALWFFQIGMRDSEILANLDWRLRFTCHKNRQSLIFQQSLDLIDELNDMSFEKSLETEVWSKLNIVLHNENCKKYKVELAHIHELEQHICSFDPTLKDTRRKPADNRQSSNFTSRSSQGIFSLRYFLLHLWIRKLHLIYQLQKFDPQNEFVNRLADLLKDTLNQPEAYIESFMATSFVNILLETAPLLSGIKDSALFLKSHSFRRSSFSPAMAVTSSKPSRKYKPSDHDANFQSSISAFQSLFGSNTKSEKFLKNLLNALQNSNQNCLVGFSCSIDQLDSVNRSQLSLGIMHLSFLISAISNESRQSLIGSYFFEVSKGILFQYQMNRKSMKALYHANYSRKAPLNKDYQIINMNNYYDSCIRKIPLKWLLISIGVGKSPDSIVISRFANQQIPLTIQLPLTRHASRETEFQIFDIQQALHDLRDIIDSNNQTTKAVGSELDRNQKKQWWAERERLNERLKLLLQKIEINWLGGFRGLLNVQEIDQSSFQKFEKTFESMLLKYIPRQRRTVKGDVEINSRLLDLFPLLINETDASNISDLIEDLLYFIFDIFQYHGHPIAYHEIDIDEFVLDVQSALETYKLDAETLTKNAYDHIVLVVDKTLHEIPWESLPSLRGKSISRLPSLFTIEQFLPKDKYPSVDVRNGCFILNPSQDLIKTQERFSDKLKMLDWGRQLIGKKPSVEVYKDYLQESSIFLYFGHNGGEQYVRGSTIMKLETKCVAMIMGCSSGQLTAKGENEPWGTPLDYLVAGSPCVVANLWDVTDKDIDNFTEKACDRWGLWSQSGSYTQKEYLSLPAAVAEARDVCKMKYLNGASPVVYGIPVWLHAQSETSS